MTQQQLAELSGVHYTTLSQLLNNKMGFKNSILRLDAFLDDHRLKGDARN